MVLTAAFVVVRCSQNCITLQGSHYSQATVGLNVVWPENSIYLKQREIIPGVVDNEMIRCQSAWTRSSSC